MNYDPGEVTLKCKTCTEEVRRSRFFPYEWVHLSDLVSLSQPQGLYDHAADPDYLDVI